ncbi:MAG: hypothetical protein AAF206_11190 [Bacteroidota bacterium]
MQITSLTERQPASELQHVIALIQEGNRDEGAELFMKMGEQKVVRHLMIRFQWSEAEATSILHDAFLLIESQIRSESITYLTISFIKRVCENLGANEYRKLMVQQSRFENFATEEKQSLQQEYMDAYGIDIYGESEHQPESGSRYQQALLAFGQLTENTRRLIKARFVDGLSHAEIAESFPNIRSADTSKTQLSRCLKYWRKAIKDLSTSGS